MFGGSGLGLTVWCAVAVTAVVGTAAPVAVAGAERPSRVVVRDGTGDVWKVNLRTSHWTLAGDRPTADVRRAVVRHRSGAVVVRTRFENLRRVGVQSHAAGLTTDDGDFFVEVTSRPGKRSGRRALYDGPGGERIECAGMSHRIDYAAETVKVRVPRSCLRDPRWVRANLGNRLVVGERPDRRHYADNPHDDGAYSNVGTRRVYRAS